MDVVEDAAVSEPSVGPVLDTGAVAGACVATDDDLPKSGTEKLAPKEQGEEEDKEEIADPTLWRPARN